MQKITPNLWFDSEAEEAAKFYTGIFKDSKINDVSHYTEAGQEIHGKEPGSVLTVAFEIEGQEFLALNAGPQFKFNESVSFIINCADQAEVDYYWDKLTEGGDEKAQICGWLKDKYGLSWQVVPTVLEELLKDPVKGPKVMTTFMQMKKIDINKLKQAAEEA